MKLDFTIGEVVTWVTVVAGIFFRSGQFSAGVEHLKKSLDEFKERFEKHADDDEHRFEELNKILLHVVRDR